MGYSHHKNFFEHRFFLALLMGGTGAGLAIKKNDKSLYGVLTIDSISSVGACAIISKPFS